MLFLSSCLLSFSSFPFPPFSFLLFSLLLSATFIDLCLIASPLWCHQLWSIFTLQFGYIFISTESHLGNIINCLVMCSQSCQNNFFIQNCCWKKKMLVSTWRRCSGLGCCFHVKSFPTMPHNSYKSCTCANVDGGVLKFHQRCIASRRQWEPNEKRPDYFGELYFQVMWEYTKSLDQNLKSGNSLLIPNEGLLENSLDHVCLLFFFPSTHWGAEFFIFEEKRGKRRKERMMESMME